MRFVIIGGGPAGNQAATHAARLGVEVTLIERDVVGGAANLWDCIPSKAMIATGGAMSYLRRIEGMGVISGEGTVDLELLRARNRAIIENLERTNEKILRSQQVDVIRGTARLPRTPPRGGGHRRRGAAHRGRRHPGEHGQPAPSPDVGRGRRRPDPHHPGRLPPRHPARPPGGGGFRGHRGGVRPHVLVAGLGGQPDRQPPAGPPAEGPRGGRRAGGRLRPPRGAPPEGGQGGGRRAGGRRA